MKLLLVFIFITTSVKASQIPAKITIPTHINVKIAKNLDKLAIHGTNLTRKIESYNQSKTFRGQKSVVFNCQSQQKQLINKNLIATISSDFPILKWNDRSYWGKFLIHKPGGTNTCDLIHQVPIENYISSLLSKEMDKNWPIEALKAQAVAARTYALYHSELSLSGGKVYHLENSEKYQVNGTMEDENLQTMKAAVDTSGEILISDKNELEPIFYHSKCGGKTLKPHEVWGGYIESYQSVTCRFCYKHGRSPWKKVVSKSQLKGYVDKISKLQASSFQEHSSVKPKDIKIIKNAFEDRKMGLYYGADLRIVSKPQMRNILGREIFPSNNFSITEQANTQQVVIQGEGYGHGVGMCQFGAYELAMRGYNYREILGYYFPNHKIQKIIN